MGWMRSLAHRLSAIDLLNKRTAVVVVVVSCLVYAGVFAFPRKVVFSYAGATCVGQLALLPGLHRPAGDPKFNLEYREGIGVRGLQITSSRLCFTPRMAPQPGVVHLASAPFGGWAFRERFDVTVGAAPQVLAATTAPQAISQPVELKLTQSDKVFTYQLASDGKTQACRVRSARLQCGVNQLGLNQGASYSLALQRSFGGRQPTTVTTIQLAILPATKVLSTSIQSNETVFTKPKSAAFVLDKPPLTAAAKLELLDGDKASPVTSRVRVDGAHVVLDWDDDLPRERTFRLSLTAAATGDGSTLDGVYAINFQTSGGPKVAGVNIGSGGVASNARVIVTFDQPLAKTADVAGLTSISGGAAGISRQGSNQIVFALRDLPRCAAFTITVAKGLLGESGVAGSRDWAQASRTTCGSSRVIGYSVKGRPITAYFYGSGPSTILFTGGIHGNEPSGTYIMQDWVAHLDANAYKIPAGRQVVVVPNLNPDGIAINQRYNANNVNIDRNFPSSDWISDIGLTNGQILPHGGGTAPFSEPETRAIADLTNSLSVRAAFSFHSSGAVVGANKVADSVAIGSAYARAAGYGTMFDNPEAVMGYTLTGEYETWMGEKAGTPAVLIELPTSTGRYFSRHVNVLWQMVGL